MGGRRTAFWWEKGGSFGGTHLDDIPLRCELECAGEPSVLGLSELVRRIWIINPGIRKLLHANAVASVSTSQISSLSHFDRSSVIRPLTLSPVIVAKFGNTESTSERSDGRHAVSDMIRSNERVDPDNAI